jgi:uncharacterized membrane protein
VLGEWFTATGQRRGFIYHHGTVRDIGGQAGRRTFYTDINDKGFITAYGSSKEPTGGQDGFLRAPDGTFTNIGALPNTESEFSMTYANALNNSNRIAGASGPLTFPDQPLRAIVWSAGVMRDLGDFGWAPNVATDINDCGKLTGYAAVPSAFFRDRVAFIYVNGRMIDIDGRPVTVERDSAGAGINNHGHVVGTSDHLSGFIYRGKRMQSLNALIDRKPGWNIVAPAAINDSGQIAATAYRNGIQYAVRLDLIRPHLARLPDSVDPATQAMKDASDVNAEARELARPVQQ